MKYSFYHRVLQKDIGTFEGDNAKEAYRILLLKQDIPRHAIKGCIALAFCRDSLIEVTQLT